MVLDDNLLHFSKFKNSFYHANETYFLCDEKCLFFSQNSRSHYVRLLDGAAWNIFIANRKLYIAQFIVLAAVLILSPNVQKRQSFE